MLSSADASSLPTTSTSPTLGNGQLPSPATSFMGYSSVWSPMLESKNSLSPLLDMKRTQSLGSTTSPQYYDHQPMQQQQQQMQQQQHSGSTHHHHYYYSALDEARQVYGSQLPSSTLAPHLSSSSPGLLLNSSRLPPTSNNSSRYYSSPVHHHHNEAMGNGNLPAMNSMMMMNGGNPNGGRRFWTDEYGHDMLPTSLQETLLTPAPVSSMRRQSQLPTPPQQQQQQRDPTVAELMELERTREALQLAAALDDMTLSDPKKFSIPPPGYVCKLCHVNGHWLKNCQLYQERRRENIRMFGPLAIKPHLATRLMATQQLTVPGRVTAPPEGYVCRKCHVPGHWIQQCPLPKHNAPPETYICKICMVKGHWIYQCPQRIPKNQLYSF